jgi:hypothetical protein
MLLRLLLTIVGTTGCDYWSYQVDDCQSGDECYRKLSPGRNEIFCVDLMDYAMRVPQDSQSGNDRANATSRENPCCETRQVSNNNGSALLIASGGWMFLVQYSLCSMMDEYLIPN